MPSCCAWWSPSTCCTGIPRKSRWVRYARTHLSGLFPGIPQQSGYYKRVTAAGTLLSPVNTARAKDTESRHEVLRALDFKPVPCGTSRETVNRFDLAGDAGYGSCPHTPATSGAVACI
jgi:hypothetical protein